VRTTAASSRPPLKSSDSSRSPGSRCDRTETSSSIAVAVSLPDRESTSAVARGQMGNRSTGVLGRALTRDITVQRGCGVGAYRRVERSLEGRGHSRCPRPDRRSWRHAVLVCADSPTASHCYGTCAAYWPPVVGTLAPSTGIVGSFATLKRSDGATQVTYNVIRSTPTLVTPHRAWRMGIASTSTWLVVRNEGDGLSTRFIVTTCAASVQNLVPLAASGKYLDCSRLVIECRELTQRSLGSPHSGHSRHRTCERTRRSDC